ncbi:amino acid ABC transporter substrate-binding protein (PAAT family) [Mobilisporobacter senegalensis]|uniref:Amino acid ABC transporter substrate-binding protein (PAAT family) n=1 Tax=Mobilisporobacter senegalensis TaxID=1329262 RepID=A0A3N1XI48_9FIRM|nr:amino acid ABC transporter substrate-binding protein [Mobilisporobacter senegalensis]ROR26406.1 amino acid ABC transporter substrate-binding protein (PAAT family) [Mobilisporobacter senegalensis]
MKKMTKISVLILMMAILLMGCGKSDANKADTSLQDIKDKGSLVLGLDDAFPPMGFKNDDQEIVGFDIDVAKEVANRIGVELELTPISWDAKEQELATKHIDCIWNGFTKNADRESKMALSIPYMKNTQVAIVLTDSGINTLEDLAGKTVVLQNASTASDAMDQNEEFKNSLKELIKVDDNVQALMDLKVGGSDAVVMDEVVARYYVEKEQGTYKVLDTTLSEEEYVIGFRKGENALTEEVNKHLKDMAKEGLLAEISEKWVGKDLTIVE